jgi:hypothetical protein
MSKRHLKIKMGFIKNRKRYRKNKKFLKKYDLDKCFFMHSKEVSSLINRTMELKQVVLEQNKIIIKLTKKIYNLKDGRN